MELNGIPLSRRTANMMFLPIPYLLTRTLLAPPAGDVPAFYREEYAEQVWDPRGDYMAECRRLNGTTCTYCGDTGWVASGVWRVFLNDAEPCKHCDMLARRHRNEKMRLRIDYPTLCIKRTKRSVVGRS